jgi:hypothetical protein
MGSTIISTCSTKVYVHHVLCAKIFNVSFVLGNIGLKLNYFVVQWQIDHCHNPSLGLATKARACKGASQEGSPGITSHAHGSVGECERMNPHTPKGVLTLEVGIPINFQIFKEQLQGSKPIKLRSFLYH